VDEGDALRYAMLLATVTVATVGAWWVYLASKTAESDAQRTIAQFLAESTHDGAPTGDPSALTNAPLPPTQPPPSFP
jgi:hypothetical protein